MAIFIKFTFALLFLLGVYGYINYANSLFEKSIYCQMTYMWVDHENEAQANRPGWPPFDPTIKCNGDLAAT